MLNTMKNNLQNWCKIFGLTIIFIQILFGRPVNTNNAQQVAQNLLKTKFTTNYSKEYFVLEAGTRAGMIAIQNNCVLLVKQYRFLINRAS